MSQPLAPRLAGVVFRRAGFRRRLLRRPVTLLALGFLVVLVALAVFAPFVAGHDPLTGGDNSLQPPLSPDHWLGTDDLGRDIWARTVYGTRISLTVGVASALIAEGSRRPALSAK